MKKSGLAVGCGWAALLLSACGGGGDNATPENALLTESGSRTTAVAPQSTILNISLPENATTVVPVGQNAGALILSGAVAGVAAAYRDGDLVLTAAEVDRIVSGTLTLASDRAAFAQVNVIVENGSAEPEYRRARALVRQSATLLALTADRQLYNHLTDLLYLSGSIQFPDKQALLRDFNPVGQASYADLQLAIIALGEALDAYERGLVTDSALTSSLHQAEVMLETHSGYGQFGLAGLESELVGAVPALSGGAFDYDPVADRWSRFQADDLFGQPGPGGEWTYWPEYQFLARFDLGSTAGSCSIQEVL